MSEIKEYITEAAVSVMRNAISDADGREVFFIGHTDENSMVTEVDVIARGTRGAVAAVTRQAEYGDVAIHNHPGSELDPSEADVTIAAQVAWTGVASYIVNNEVTDIYVLVEPVRPEQLVPIDKGVLTALMGMDGALARSLPNFEERAAQQLMIAEVVDAFNFDKISLIEAGTGTGKTLAYLVPAVAWALANKERVVVSTHTINLQEQIINKDLPIVRLLFEEEFKAVLVKGR